MEIKDQRSKLSFDELIERCGNAKVLVVDDKQENIQVVGTLLKSLSWIRLYVALSGQKALEATMEYRPDLILLDLNMVDMDGLETLKRLRDLEALEFATVIFLTADQAKENRLEGLSLGCADYIQKPFDQEEFLIKVAYHIKMRLYEKVLLKNFGDTAALLNNINQAIFCTNKDGLIMAPVSDHSQVIFGENPSGKSIYDLVFSKASLRKDELKVLKKNFSDVYESSKINWAIESAKFPDKVNVEVVEQDDKILKIAYTPLWNNEVLESIMMTFEDITDKERFAKEKNQYNLQQIAQIVDLKVETLRTWTKRYGISGEFKDSKGEYRFSGVDLERFNT
ncbi:MAG: response regulator [Bdellovibrionota bacterium]|nr:response regulator [Bdellovibrionota bacterium]